MLRAPVSLRARFGRALAATSSRGRSCDLRNCDGPEFADEAAEASLAWLEKRKPRFAASYTADGAERRVHKV
jgi:hypothetical protein